MTSGVLRNFHRQAERGFVICASADEVKMTSTELQGGIGFSFRIQHREHSLQNKII